MKKRILTAIFTIVLCLIFSVPAFAADTDGFASEDARVIDDAGLLTDSEADDLIAKLDEISERQQFDVVIVTADSLDGATVRDYADDMYDYCNFGYGEDRDGVLLLISMEDRDWYISTCGYGETAFTDAGIQYIGDQMGSNLSDGNYAAAFNTYAEQCDIYITQARTDTPYDSSSLPRQPLSLIWIPISLVIGFVIALIAVGIMKSKLKTVRSQAAANSYVKDGSLNVTECRDVFLYCTVNRTERPKEDSSSGSSTHTSSSGTTHGGGGGKF